MNIIYFRPEVANQYYKMLTERILDTGVSVRKRVIKILRDLCLEVKDFPFIGNACIRLVNILLLVVDNGGNNALNGQKY